MLTYVNITTWQPRCSGSPAMDTAREHLAGILRSTLARGFGARLSVFSSGQIPTIESCVDVRTRRIAAVANRDLERLRWARKRTYREGAESAPSRRSHSRFDLVGPVMIEVGMKVGHARFVAFRMAEVALSKTQLAEILRIILVSRLGPVASTGWKAARVTRSTRTDWRPAPLRHRIAQSSPRDDRVSQAVIRVLSDADRSGESRD